MIALSVFVACNSYNITICNYIFTFKWAQPVELTNANVLFYFNIYHAYQTVVLLMNLNNMTERPLSTFCFCVYDQEYVTLVSPSGPEMS